MAEEADNEDKTFDASPRRREEARKQGRFAFSADLSNSVLLLAGTAGLVVLGPWMGGKIMEVFRTDFANLPVELRATAVQEMFLRLGQIALLTVGGFFGIVLATSVIVSIVQSGFHITPERMEPDFNRLNPATNFQRLFSMGSIAKGLFAVIKVVALGYIAYVLIKGRQGSITSVGHDTLSGAATTSWSVVMRIAMIMSAVMVLVGVADFFYQYRKFEGSIRMTLKEFKDEVKEEDGDPQIKQERRRIARERIKRKMLQSVPTSAVVLTNPKHYAVALRYRQGVDVAPVVVAKGAGTLAAQIRRVAEQHDVPILERPELTRLLYRSVREDQAIPAGLFVVVAQVIAFVYQLRRAGMR